MISTRPRTVASSANRSTSVLLIVSWPSARAEATSEVRARQLLRNSSGMPPKSGPFGSSMWRPFWRLLSHTASAPASVNSPAAATNITRSSQSLRTAGARNTMPASCEPVSVKLYRLLALTSLSRGTSAGTRETTAGVTQHHGEQREQDGVLGRLGQPLGEPQGRESGL